MKILLILNLLLIGCLTKESIERHLDSTSYYYACMAVLRYGDQVNICDDSLPSANLNTKKAYKKWLNDQAPYVEELESVCRSDKANYQRMKDLFDRDNRKIELMKSKNPEELLKLCQDFRDGLSKHPKDESKKMLQELVH